MISSEGGREGKRGIRRGRLACGVEKMKRDYHALLQSDGKERGGLDGSRKIDNNKDEE